MCVTFVAIRGPVERRLGRLQSPRNEALEDPTIRSTISTSFYSEVSNVGFLRFSVRIRIH